MLHLYDGIFCLYFDNFGISSARHHSLDGIQTIVMHCDDFRESQQNALNFCLTRFQHLTKMRLQWRVFFYSRYFIYDFSSGVVVLDCSTEFLEYNTSNYFTRLCIWLVNFPLNEYSAILEWQATDEMCIFWTRYNCTRQTAFIINPTEFRSRYIEICMEQHEHVSVKLSHFYVHFINKCANFMTTKIEWMNEMETSSLLFFGSFVKHIILALCMCVVQLIKENNTLWWNRNSCQNIAFYLKKFQQIRFVAFHLHDAK